LVPDSKPPDKFFLVDGGGIEVPFPSEEFNLVEITSKVIYTTFIVIDFLL